MVPSHDVSPSGPAVRVAVRADDQLLDAGLREHLRVERWTRVVDVTEAPDVVVVAAARPPGIDVLRALAEDPARPVVVVVSNAATEAWRDGELLAAVECGVVAVLEAGELTAARLLRCLRVVLDGGADLPVTVQGRLLRDVVRVQREVLAPAGLSASGATEREREVLRLLAEGLELREIAERLSFSERTVKNVLYSLMQRLGLRNRVHAVSYALRTGLI